MDPEGKFWYNVAMLSSDTADERHNPNHNIIYVYKFIINKYKQYIQLYTYKSWTIAK